MLHLEPNVLIVIEFRGTQSFYGCGIYGLFTGLTSSLTPVIDIIPETWGRKFHRRRESFSVVVMNKIFSNLSAFTEGSASDCRETESQGRNGMGCFAICHDD